MVLIPTMIKNFLGFNNDYPLKLFEKDSKEALPCQILSYGENQSWELPTEPIETAEFIGDTQYRQPRSYNLVCFVLDEAVSEFERQIKEIQTNKNGFCFTDRDGVLYSDLWLTDLNKSTDLANNGIIFNINLQELILIEAFNNEISYQKTSNAGLSGKTNNGEQTNNAKKTKNKM